MTSDGGNTVGKVRMKRDEERLFIHIRSLWSGFFSSYA